MLIIVGGGSASGKSAFAEQLLSTSGAKEKYYIATMRPVDAECTAKIARHRRLRQEQGFVTLECYDDWAGLAIPEQAAVLVECLSNWLTNELYHLRRSVQEAQAVILDDVAHLAARCRQVIVVTNDVFSDGLTYDAMSQQYLAALGQLNVQLARQAEQVVEVCAGQPIYYKGRPW